MTLYQKVLSVFALIRTSIALRAAREELAPLFNETHSYAKGRLVVYDDALWKCTDAHSGAWDPAHFARTTIDEALASLDVSALKGVKLNGTELTSLDGVVDVPALKGVKLNGEQVVPKYGIVDIKTGSYGLNYVENGDKILLSHRNIYDAETSGFSPVLHIENDDLKMRDFSFVLRIPWPPPGDGYNWDGEILDGDMSVNAIYNGKTNTLDGFIREYLLQLGDSRSPYILFVLNEICSNLFALQII